MINGAFFPPHAMERTEERTGIRDFDQTKYEQKFIDLDGILYWDTKHSNYQLGLHNVVFPFKVKVHRNRPGLIAIIKTALPPEPEYRRTCSRFIRLEHDSDTECPCCESSVDPGDVAKNLEDLETTEATS
jgi:hypothetical protein